MAAAAVCASFSFMAHHPPPSLRDDRVTSSLDS